MKNPHLNRLAAIGVALPMLLAISTTTALPQQGDACLSGRQIQQALDAGEIVQLNEAMRSAGIQEEPIGRANVCKQNGELKYRLNFMNSYGESETRDLPAEDH